MNLTEEQFRVLLAKYLAGEAGAQEQALLDHWFEMYKTDALADATPIDAAIGKQMYAHLQGRIPALTSARRFYQAPIVWAVAAVVTLSLMLWLFLAGLPGAQHLSTQMAPGMITRAVPRGEKATVQLPDGTRVRLNAASTLRYPKVWPGNLRQVFLTGEGYFEVVDDPERPFCVTAGSVKTTVLGTSFNFKAVAGYDTEVTLVKGKVNVQAWTVNHDTMQVMLHPNQQALVGDAAGTIIKQNVGVEKYIAWKNNTLYFDHTPLREAIREMEAWYDTKLELENEALGQCIINAKYQHETLDNVLESLHFLLNISYERKDGKIVLTGKGCH